MKSMWGIVKVKHMGVNEIKRSVKKMSGAKALALALTIIVSACGPSQAEKAKVEAEKVAKIEAERVAKAKASDDRKRSICSDVIEVTEAFFRASGSLSDEAEMRLSGRVAQAEAAYRQSMRYGIVVGSDIERIYTAKNAYIEAYASQKEAKIAVLEQFKPLGNALSASVQAEKVAKAGGAVLNTNRKCAEARNLIDVSLETVNRLERRFKSVEESARAQREIIEAADNRLKAESI